LFGPGSQAEVPISGVVGSTVISAQVDRLWVGASVVRVIDFKSDRRPPARAQDTPAAYLRQMASYRAALSRIYPGREVECLLLWTEGPVAMTLPAALLAAHLPSLLAA